GRSAGGGAPEGLDEHGELAVRRRECRRAPAGGGMAARRRGPQPGEQSASGFRDLAERSGDDTNDTTGRPRPGEGRIARRSEMRRWRAGSNQSAKQAKQHGENKEPAKQRHEKPDQIERIR